VVEGHGFIVPIWNVNPITITSAKIYVGGAWKTLTFQFVIRGTFQQAIAFTGAVEAGAESGKCYLCAITGSVS